MIPKPKGPKAKAQGITSSSTIALAAAARSTAAAVEQLAKMASESAHQPSAPVSSSPVSSAACSSIAVEKAKAIAKIGATLPVLDHPIAKPSKPIPAHTKSFAGRYPPVDPQRRAAWDNMVQDYGKQKEQDKKNGIKRKWTQGDWYNLHAERYGLQLRKRPSLMKKPSGNPPGL